MKKLFVSALCIVATCYSYAQTIVKNPDIGFDAARNITLTQLEINDTATVLSFLAKNKPGSWISIPKQTYIQPVGAEKLFIASAKGIPLGARYTMPDSGVVHYQLVFPLIPETTRYIDYGEANDGGTWFIYDIAVQPMSKDKLLPESFWGEWKNKTNGKLEYFISEKNVVADMQLWQIQSFKGSDKKGELTLVNGDQQKLLFLKRNKTNEIFIGETKKTSIAYSNQNVSSAINATSEYKLPVFENDSVTYAGCLLNYKPRYGDKTGTIHVNNILTGSQESHLVKINDDGSFAIKLPFYYPHQVFVRMPYYYAAVHLEPGAHLFHVITPKVKGGIYMGDCAKINADLSKLEDLGRFNYREVERKVLEMSLQDYKDYCFKGLKADMEQLDKLKSEGKITAKAYQIKKFDLEYDAMSNAMEYDWKYESAYRKKHNIPRSQRNLEIEYEQPEQEYYDFLTPEKIENPLAVISNNFDTFYNRVKFLPQLRQNRSVAHNDILMQMPDSEFTVEENILRKKMKELEELKVKSGFDQIEGEIKEQSTKFWEKYRSDIESFMTQNNKEYDFEKFVEYLTGKGVQFSEVEKEFIEKQKKLVKTEYSEKMIAFHKAHGDEVRDLMQKKNERIKQLISFHFVEMSNKRLEELFGVEEGFTTDVFYSENLCRGIVEELTPISESELKEAKAHIKTPFIADYIELMNNNTIEKNNQTRKSAESVVNEVPETEGEKLFDEMMKKYKGKVVLVDFWATWCGPCRSGIKRIAPLKEEMKDEDVVFVYITNTTSPEHTYNNMIKTIDGEHYRVSKDEWNYLSEQFNISGIPHCTLVGRNGEVINPHLRLGMRNPELKKLFKQHL